MNRIIIVSNRLPVRVQKKGKNLQFIPSEGGLATGLGSAFKDVDCIWIGWPGISFTGEKEKAEVSKVLKGINMAPVFLSQKEIKEFYEGFSNELLWPNFHYFPQKSVFHPSYWEAYQKVNTKFANSILAIAKPGDIIWVQDYQLFLVPEMLRKKGLLNHVGFFLHIPFPAYEVFRLLPHREELIRGLLGSDLIGFHTQDYLQYFLETVSRLLGLEIKEGTIEFEGRQVFADAFPMGIDFEKFDNLARQKKVLKLKEKYKRDLNVSQVALGIDRLDYSKGIPERLKAFENLLKNYPECRGKISFVQVLVPSRDKVQAYKELKEEINRLAGQINSNYGSTSWTPVFCFYRSFPPEALSAFYSLADFAWVTPVRDGMNLVCKEYVASRTEEKGVLLLSEMAGASMELTEALLVNPLDKQALMLGMLKAIQMPEEEKGRRMKLMREIVRKFNISHFVSMFLNRLWYALERQNELHTRILEIEPGEEIYKQYYRSRNRLIFLDYDGTLVPFADTPEKAIPGKPLLNLLKKLSSEPGNRIVLISGRPKAVLEKWFGKLPVDLVADHGIWMKREGIWEIMENLGTSWKESIRKLMQEHADRTPGAFIEEKDFSLVWHYRRVESGLARLRSRELISHLRFLLRNNNIQILEGNKVIEVKNVEINKGRAAQKWMDEDMDFIMAIGDDNTDEDLFKVLPENAFTIKVRERISVARYHLKSHAEVLKLLKLMTGQKIRTES